MRFERDNAAAIREALAEISKFADDWESYANTKAGALDRIYELANAAISAPARNCDVGTAEEQAERQSRFCLSHHGDCKRCPANRTTHSACVLAWSQMPYEAERKGECDGR